MEKWLTQASDGVIFFAVALFDLSTSSGLVVTLVVLDALLALAGSMFGFFMLYRTVQSIGEAGQG